MKQKGKMWYTHKGEQTLAKYVPPLQQACERIGQKIAATAEEIEKRLSQAKYDFHKLCMEAYQEYLKTGQPVKRFSFLTFDKMIKVEFDVAEGYIRAYRATKKDPSHKDYELINLDFSATKPVNSFSEKDVVNLVHAGVGGQLKTESTEEVLQERNTVTNPPDLFAKYPLTEDEAFKHWDVARVEEKCYFICSDKANQQMFDGALSLFQTEEATVSSPDTLPVITNIGDCYIVHNPEERRLYKLRAVNHPEKKADKIYSIEQVKELCVFVAADEDDKDHYAKMVDEVPQGPWVICDDQNEDNDYTIRQNGDWFIINDCGRSDLYRLKSVAENTTHNAIKKMAKDAGAEPCLCGQKTIEECLNSCPQLGRQKVDKMMKS